MMAPPPTIQNIVQPRKASKEISRFVTGLEPSTEADDGAAGDADV